MLTTDGRIVCDNTLDARYLPPTLWLLLFASKTLLLPSPFFFFLNLSSCSERIVVQQKLPDFKKGLFGASANRKHLD